MDTDGQSESMNRTTTPVLQEEPDTVDVGAYSTARKGFDKNQDRHYISNLNYSDIMLTYVFDGHGGSIVSSRLFETAMSSFSSVNLFLELGSILTDNLDNERARLLAENVFARISKMFVGFDTMGSTAVIGIHQKSTNRVRFLHVGDSRAVWRVHRRRTQEIINHADPETNTVYNNETIEFVTWKDGETSDHKPNRPDETQRINKLGGTVIQWNGISRVNGNLAVSRAFGDTGLHPYVCSVPEVSPLIELKSGDCYILASDGVWDVISSQDALKRVAENFQVSSSRHAHDLVTNCCTQSKDDTTAIVVKVL